MKTKKKKPYKILIINGPNLHLLGKRETKIYGLCTLSELKKMLNKKGAELGLKIEHFQSNSEGEIVNKITKGNFDFLIINPAAYTHTSVAIRDALLCIEEPAIEVHISNIHKREKFRKTSLISDVVVGVITGLGVYGYLLALEVAQLILREK